MVGPNCGKDIVEAFNTVTTITVTVLPWECAANLRSFSFRTLHVTIRLGFRSKENVRLRLRILRCLVEGIHRLFSSEMSTCP